MKKWQVLLGIGGLGFASCAGGITALSKDIKTVVEENKKQVLDVNINTKIYNNTENSINYWWCPWDDNGKYRFGEETINLGLNNISPYYLDTQNYFGFEIPIDDSNSLYMVMYIKNEYQSIPYSTYFWSNFTVNKKNSNPLFNDFIWNNGYQVIWIEENNQTQDIKIEHKSNHLIISVKLTKDTWSQLFEV